MDAVLRKLYGDGKPLLFVVLTIQYAAAAELTCEMLAIARGTKRAQRPMPVPADLQAWLACYRDHRRVLAAVSPVALAEIAPDPVADGSVTLPRLADGWRDFLKLPPEEMHAEVKSWPAEQQVEVLRALRGVAFPPDNAFVADVLKRLDAWERGDEKMEALMPSTEMQFFLRVWMPCWIEYKMAAPQLFHRACSGYASKEDRIDWLDRLLRLDKSVLAEPRIAQQWHEAAQSPQRGRFRRLCRAVQGQPPNSAATPKKLKKHVAGLIAQMAEGFQCPVTEPEIRAIFDSVAGVRRGSLRDRDLPASSDTLYRAIQRHRTWPGLPRRKRRK